ncbi:MAG: tail fiber protein [Bacteroides sp.]|nr:tail fiber protein [Bacteroides sp.]
MKTVLGNFLLQPNQDFPLDCELLDNLQNHVFLLSVIGNVAGDKVILYGCELSGTSRRNEGYVFLRTKDHPEGEVLYWEGGDITSGMYVSKEAVSVTAQGYEYQQAYTVRILCGGVGSENYKWSDFHDLTTLPELQQRIKEQDASIGQLAAPPLGLIQIWAGRTIPENYLLCEGQSLSQSAYPELYAVLGTTFNTTPDYNGNNQSTISGQFRLPDLRGRFVVGRNSSDTEYNSMGKAGGKKTVALTTEEMPPHTHTYELYANGSKDHGRYSSKGNRDGDKNDVFNTGSTGGRSGSAQAHENRPPFYTLAYIIRVR